MLIPIHGVSNRALANLHLSVTLLSIMSVVNEQGVECACDNHTIPAHGFLSGAGRIDGQRLRNGIYGVLRLCRVLELS